MRKTLILLCFVVVLLAGCKDNPYNDNVYKTTAKLSTCGYDVAGTRWEKSTADKLKIKLYDIHQTEQNDK